LETDSAKGPAAAAALKPPCIPQAEMPATTSFLPLVAVFVVVLVGGVGDLAWCHIAPGVVDGNLCRPFYSMLITSFSSLK